MLKYVIGDATEPQGDGNKIICHICNDIGAWGAGFVLAVSKKWKFPEEAYRAMSKEQRKLGETQLVFCERKTNGDVIFVANMIAQHDIKPEIKELPIGKQVTPPIRYFALADCLQTVRYHAITNHATVHMPRIGAGLAGGDWKEIESYIKGAFPDVDVTVYDLVSTPKY